MSGLRSESGLALRELLVAMVILFAMTTMVVYIISAADRASEKTLQTQRLREVDQRVLDEIRAGLADAACLFGTHTRNPNSSVESSSALLARLEYPDGLSPIPFTSLPRLRDSGRFEVEPSPASRTGNALLYLARDVTIQLRTETAETYRVDSYRLIACYLAAEGEDPGPRHRLRLCRFVSVPFALTSQIDSIKDDLDRREVVHALRNPNAKSESREPIAYLCRPRGSALDWLQTLHSDPIARMPCTTIPVDSRRSTASLIDDDAFAVATNDAPRAAGVARYAMSTDVDGGFPHGFEVQIIGPRSKRRLLLHLSLVSAGSGPDVKDRGPVASSDLISVVIVREQEF